MIRQLFTSVFCAFALFFLLLTGEEALHAQNADYQDSNTLELVNEYLVSQHVFKATSVFKETSFSEAEVFTSPSTSIATKTYVWCINTSFSESFLPTKTFLLDQRKRIGQQLYPYHFFW